MRILLFASLALMLPMLAQAQSNPTSRLSSGVVHGQRPDMRQDLHNAPGAATAGGGVRSPQAPQTRTQQVQQRSQAAQQQQRRATQQQRQAQQGHAAQARRTGVGTPAARAPNSTAAHEARMADASRRQSQSRRQAADRQSGVALGR